MTNTSTKEESDKKIVEILTSCINETAKDLLEDLVSDCSDIVKMESI